MGYGKKHNHHVERLPRRQPPHETVEGSPTGFARKLIPTDEVEECHRLAAQRMDHLIIVDGPIVLAG